jgi:hypothetical protein
VVDSFGRYVRAPVIGRFTAIVGLLLVSIFASAQIADFQIVWINVGEVAAAKDGDGARAGRQLFMAPDLVQFSLDKITVARVDVAPSVIPLKIGQRFCMTSLHVQASTEDKQGVKDAPLSVSVRQDQRERLAIKRSKRNICFAPTESGEYPVRLNSLLPARDGTMRGAQIFLRVGQDPPPEETPTGSVG